MVPIGPTRRRSARFALVVMTVATVMIGMQAQAGAQPSGAAAKAGHAKNPPNVTGLAKVARPTEARPAPLPRRTGSVPVVKARRRRPGHRTEQVRRRRRPHRQGRAARAGRRPPTPTTSACPPGTPPWTGVGAAYDVLYDATTRSPPSTLVRPDGVGKYNAILLTNSMQVYDVAAAATSAAWTAPSGTSSGPTSATSGSGRPPSTPATAPGPRTTASPRPARAAVGDTPLNVSLTAAGAGVFDYLKSQPRSR